LNDGETRIRQKEQSLNQKLESLDKQAKDNDIIKENLNRQIEVVNQKRTELEKHQEEHIRRLEKIAAAFSGIKIGPADAPDTRLGPVISAAQVRRCEHFVKLAVERGGKVVFGGKRPAGLEGGFYFEPTVLDLPDNDNPAAQEEIFGPVIAVIGYRDPDHAVRMANASRYGLSGYVYGADRKKAFEVGLRVRSGTVNVNGAMMSTFVSAGGQRMSGLARERGSEGIRLYQQLSCLNLA